MSVLIIGLSTPVIKQDQKIVVPLCLKYVCHLLRNYVHRIFTCSSFIPSDWSDLSNCVAISIWLLLSPSLFNIQPLSVYMITIWIQFYVRTEHCQRVNSHTFATIPKKVFHVSTPNKRLWVVIGRTFPLQHTFSSIPRTTEWWWWWWLIAISPWGKESAEVRRLSPAKSCFCRWLELCAAVHYVKRRVFRYQFAYRMCPRPGPGWSHSFKWQHSSSEVVLRILAGVFV